MTSVAGFDEGDLLRREGEIERGDGAFDLGGGAGADDRGRDGGQAAGPGDGNDAGAHAAFCADLLEAVGDGEVFAELGLLEVRVALAPIVVGQGGDPFGGHGTGEHARTHGRVVDHADVVRFAVGQNLRLDIAIEQGVGRLQGSDLGDFVRFGKLLDVEVGGADPAHFALVLEFGHGGPAFERRAELVVRPMHLVEVDRVGVEAAQAGFDFGADGLLGIGVVDVAGIIPDHGALGEDERPFAFPLRQRPCHDLLGVAESVDGGGVDPIDAELECPQNGGHGLVVVLAGPAEFPGAAHGPRAEADGGELQVGVAELSKRHEAGTQTLGR